MPTSRKAAAGLLIALPACIPTFNLGLWTGWQTVTEADLLVLIIVGILAWRMPLSRQDFLPTGLPRIAILALIAAIALATVIGLATSVGFAGPSDNAFLRRDNALRIAKGFVEALVLFPFLRQRQRRHGDATTVMAWGMSAGVIVVSLLVIAERLLFTGLFDFTADYRAIGPFASMRVGGGHVGAYFALALPFVMVLPWTPAGTVMALCAGLAGAYALIVTFARTGYAAAAVGVLIAGVCVALQALATGSPRRGLRTITLGLLVLASLAAASLDTGMRQRLTTAAGDLATREANWRIGWATRDQDALTALFGMGLGSYQRAQFARATSNQPSDIRVERDPLGPFVHIVTRSPFFLGQKIVPPHGDAHVSLRIRAAAADDVLGVLLCDKVLVYSDRCRGADTRPATPGAWETVTLTVPSDGLGSGILGGLIRRPIELSLFNTHQGGMLDIAAVTATDSEGRPLLANGDFEAGLFRWIFTDDSHVSWRILNQYLMLMYETGAVGSAAILFFFAIAALAAVRAVRRDDHTAAAILGALCALAVSGMFDNVFEAPRLTTLYTLIALLGLTLWDEPASSDRQTLVAGGREAHDEATR